MKRSVFLICGLLIACAPASTQTVISTTLIPYETITPSHTPEGPPGLVFSNETPLPSPTPFTYVVKEGDTLSAIAEEYGISLDDLQAVNPTISPASMPIGTVLQIPSRSSDPLAESTPTPAPLLVREIGCHPDALGGLWCYVLLENDTSQVLENVSARFTLVNANAEDYSSVIGWLLLDILPVGSVVPVMVYFPSVTPVDLKPQVQILSAIPLPPDDDRYPVALLQNILVEVDWSGRSAQVSGQVTLSDGSKEARSVWLAAVAYDASGRLVGARRWESPSGLQPGASLPFKFLVSSLAGEIDRVELAVEAPR
jgi:LysM repeat protein